MTSAARVERDPIRVLKAGWVLLAADRRSGRFAGLSVGAPYRAHDRARCFRERCPVDGNHAAPHPRGTCGFYGSTGDPLAWMLPEAALLDVELFGRVIRHERGWRAGGQRVLGVRFLHGCAACLRPVTGPLLVTAPAPVDTRGVLVAPRCARCAQVWRSPSYGDVLEPAELAGLLGTEVSWLDPVRSARVLQRQARSRRPGRPSRRIEH
ncbi:MAG TPA: hypothetical protein VM324_07065 [Egibacteraceae bacterium]|nr:hypothetical protein [Egibacteraceae bacterium]